MRVAQTLAFVVPALVFACNGSSEKADDTHADDAPAPAEAQPQEPPSATSHAATPTTAAGTSGTPIEAAATGAAATEAAPTEAAPTNADTDQGGETPALQGPCSVKWSNGAHLRFTYDDRSATARLDEDDDGKAEHCARLEIADERLAKLEMDPGCTGKGTYVLTPTYDAESNIAVADYTEREGGKSRARSITMVTLPSFVGLEPGYTMYAKRSGIKFVVRQGRVHTARVRRPFSGPPLEAKFTYDDRGRIKTISEDLESNGTIDRKLDYGYDERGRITRMEVTYGPQAIPEKNSARLDYGCWSE